MQKQDPGSAPGRTGKRTNIGLALVIALGLHMAFLLLPINRQPPPTDDASAKIEVQLINIKPALVTAPVVLQETEPHEPPPESQTPPLATPESPVNVVATQPEPVSPAAPVVPEARMSARVLHTMSTDEKRQLTNAVLLRQFVTGKSATDQLFGQPLPSKNTTPQQDFVFPVRPSMVAMLDQPMPDVPFAYTPGLVYFAYDPGVKGDLQRFWDVITPEFGWRTDNGTEFRCVLVLVIVGCGWK